MILHGQKLWSRMPPSFENPWVLDPWKVVLNCSAKKRKQLSHHLFVLSQLGWCTFCMKVYTFYWYIWINLQGENQALVTFLFQTFLLCPENTSQYTVNTNRVFHTCMLIVASGMRVYFGLNPHTNVYSELCEKFHRQQITQVGSFSQNSGDYTVLNTHRY